ncbi:MAG: hypothetical protein K2X39_06295 [Silvanigrellaceae bacterium]|nr:hypothetical protein [Silvanigrellaceae bacterium]
MFKCMIKTLQRAFGQRLFTSISMFFLFQVCYVNKAFCSLVYDLPEQTKLEVSGSIKYAIRPFGRFFSFKASDQRLEHQPTSEASYLYNESSLGADLLFRNDVSFHMSFHYSWVSPPTNSFQLTREQGKVLYLRNLFLRLPLNEDYYLWSGARRILFPKIKLFEMDNPFTQDFIGGGVESSSFKAFVSIDNGEVSTAAENAQGEQIKDLEGNLVFHVRPEKIITLFVSKKFLLAEGQVFEPIFLFRYYSWSNFDKNNLNSVKMKVLNSTGFVFGGVFSRPLTYGTSGSTSLWFQNLPGNYKTVHSSALESEEHLVVIKSNKLFHGQGRVTADLPQNVIGLADSSEFYLGERFGLITALHMTNNYYDQPVTEKVSFSQQDSAMEMQRRTVKIVNRFSLGLQPVYFFLKNMQFALDVNALLVDKKIFKNDANALIISPLFRYTMDGILNSEKYAFISISYGYYDWKVKRNIYSEKTDQLISLQLGLSYSI